MAVGTGRTTPGPHARKTARMPGERRAKCPRAMPALWPRSGRAKALTPASTSLNAIHSGFIPARDCNQVRSCRPGLRPPAFRPFTRSPARCARHGVRNGEVPSAVSPDVRLRTVPVRSPARAVWLWRARIGSPRQLTIALDVATCHSDTPKRPPPAMGRSHRAPALVAALVLMALFGPAAAISSVFTATGKSFVVSTPEWTLMSPFSDTGGGTGVFYNATSIFTFTAPKNKARPWGAQGPPPHQ
jgi:hypothetical protein